MSENGRGWRVLAGGIGACAGVAGVLGVTGTASAQPLPVQPTVPSPATVAQPVPAAPNAVPLQPGVTPATAGVAAVPAGVTAATPPAVPAAPAIVPATSGTLTDFFAGKGITLEPQSSQDFRALNIVLPMPRGWQHIPDPNVPDAFAVIADRVGGNGLYSSNAQVVIYKLVGGDFDPKEAISHGFIDAQQLPAWRSTNASLSDFGGMPSSLIEGTYRENAMTLNTSRRHVLATVGPDRYLVSLAVTTSVDQVVAAADATDAIVKGFKVSVPSAAPAPAAPPGVAPAPLVPAPPAPAVPAAVAPPPQLLGLQG
ncbi:LpqN/LpqT family lipoprotein [Mycolicibacterium rufum]|uniref:LpqN/LpqT family lipoprotein n=1 Tax=Mycolicibacterium rufum TaxID=318424 RepID=A0ABY3UGT9_9MYCO|nr:LpqN/LpqT family lipoprotein [Mycolicibacterium rufum]KGI66141.1 proline-rich antigen [Mycolicibacterium rufum]ULP36886.1 LpqN/LpqT family lipoprotein [Mycolicibacterium rufum]